MGSLLSRIGFPVTSQRRNRNSNLNRSQLDDVSTNFNITFTKETFCNYFYMGGERFEINETGYLFGDNTDLNFLSSTKPHYIPYKQAKQNLLLNLNKNMKQSGETLSERVNHPLLMKFFRRYRRKRNHGSNDIDDDNNNNISNNNNSYTNDNINSNLNSNKRDAQTQTTNGNTSQASTKEAGIEPSKPIPMMINIRKETLRLVRPPQIEPAPIDVAATGQHDLASVTKSPADPIQSTDTQFTANQEKGEDQEQSTKDEVSGQEQVCITIPDQKGDMANLEDKDATNQKDESHTNEPVTYNIEFSFDAEVSCSIRIFYMSTREVSQTGINYRPQKPTYKSKLYEFEKGIDQRFNQPDFEFKPSIFEDESLSYKLSDENYKPDKLYPLVVHCVAREGPEPRQSQSLIATIEKNEETYSIKPLKQLIFHDGIQFILQDVYGVENNELLCVICMSDGRNTMLLPCRHLCLCSPCAQSLTHQANSCPICRRSFRAALNLSAS